MPIIKPMQKILCFILFITVPIAAFAQARLSGPAAEYPFWFVFEEGKKAFHDENYGKALELFEEARAGRRTRFSRLEASFISLLSIGEVRRIGDSLDFIEKYIEERNQSDADAALAELVHRVGRDALKNSAKTALEFFGKLKEYPEVEYWIGEIYRLEGEFPIAISQYQKALNDNAEPKAPAWRINVLYKIAEVSRDMQNYTKMESTLNEILKNDKFWNESGNFIRNAMTKTLSNDGINNFLVMYRNKNSMTEQAHRMLGEFCYKSGRYMLAENHLSFAVLEQNTVLIEEAKRKRFDYAFSTLDDLIHEINRRPDLKKYMIDVEYYRTLYYLSTALYAQRKTAAAKEIWTFIAGHNEAGEWSRRSQNQLVKPFVEKTVKMP
ncbi:MAG: hypothetical protein LBD07_02920 [Spirochaetaceae bacterium]|jgi:tetratricopeptide (TPR) repeat protein|nr:hypothetical protein [Spirochaetaceae bacterium]